MKLKSWPEFFQKTLEGTKTSDIRSKIDRDFYVGQKITLQEFDPFGTGYTGREQDIEVTHIISNDTPCALSSAVLDRNFCVLSIKPLKDK